MNNWKTPEEGDRFNRLTVIGKSDKTGKRGEKYWKCLCVCGETKHIRQDALVKGKTKSCGCLAREIIVKRNTKHGMFGTKTYNTWSKMKSRCYKKNNINYSAYGGRGITVCDEWRFSFENFYKDVGEIPKGMTIDRINNDGNYEPGNIRIANYSQQNINRRMVENATGCSFDKKYKKWNAEIRRNGKRFFLGAFKKKEDGMAAYKKAKEKMDNPQSCKGTGADGSGLGRCGLIRG